MKPTNSVLPVRLTKALCILAGIYAAAVAAYLFTETPKPSSASDFHAYWYAGHFLIEGRDPYQAYINNEQPSLPVRYWDGVVTRSSTDDAFIKEVASLPPEEHERRVVAKL